MRAQDLRSRILIVVALVAVSAAPAAAAGNETESPKAPESALVTLESNEIKLRQAIQFILRDRATSFVTGEALDQMISIKLVNVEWRKALEHILRTHGYTYVEEDGILQVLRLSDSDTSPEETRMPFLFTLDHADPIAAEAAVKPLLSDQGVIVRLDGKDGNTLSIIDVPQSINVINRLLEKLDVPPKESKSRLSRNEDGTIDIGLEDFPLSKLGSLFHEKLGLNVFVQESLSGKTTLNLTRVDWKDALTLILSEHDFAFREEGGVVIIDDKESFQETRVTKQFALKYLDGRDVEKYFKGLLGEGDSITSFSAAPRAGFELGTKVSDPRAVQKDEDVERNRRSKFISITARPDTLATIEKRLLEIDVKPRQVDIDVKVVQIERDYGAQRGIDWTAILSFEGAARPTNLPFGPHNGKFFPGDFLVPAPGFEYGLVRADELVAVLRMIEQSDKTEIISEPNISTLDTTEADILVGQKFPVTTEKIDPETGLRTITLEYYEDIGIQLLVVPRITEGNRVHLVIHPAVSSLGELIEGRFPIINTREADAQLLLRSGETAVIGGLLENTTITVDRGVPILGKIPWLGAFFSYEEEFDLKTELVIFVTPTIVLSSEEVHAALQIPRERVAAMAELSTTFTKLLDQ